MCAVVDRAYYALGVLATAAFALALLLFVGNLQGPYEWDGRLIEPDPAWATLQFIAALTAFAAIAAGAFRRRKKPFILAWLAATAAWAAVVAVPALF